MTDFNPDQRALIGPQQDTSPSSTEVKSKLLRPILQFIAHFGVVSSYHVLYRFWTHKAKSPVYGWRLLKQIEDAGYITSGPIEPEKGNRSVKYLRLTQEGWERISRSCPRELKGPLPDAELLYRIQYAEMALIRSKEGFREVSENRRMDALKGWALAQFRNRHLSDSDLFRRTGIERLTSGRILNPIWLHTEKGLLRIVVPAIEGRTAGHSIRSLPDLKLFEYLSFEVVGVHQGSIEGVIRFLRRKSDSHFGHFEIHTAQHFSKRPNPRRAYKG